MTSDTAPDDATPDSRGKVVFPRVARESTLADRVADLLLETIMSEGLRPGNPLPSERELGEQFGVSRTVIREAVRSLAAKGVIEARTGRRLRVAAVDAASVSESMGLYLRGSLIGYEKVHEVRKLIEVEIAGLSAERASAEAIALATENCEKMEAAGDDLELAAECDLQFHRAIAIGSGNPLYLLLLDSIGDALLDVRRINLQRGASEAAYAHHRNILNRIVEHDVEGARRAMADHLDQVARYFKQHGGAHQVSQRD